MRFLSMVIMVAMLVSAASLASAQTPAKRSEVGTATSRAKSVVLQSVKIYVDRSPSDTSDIYAADPKGRWWYRMNVDANGNPARAWGMEADGRYYIVDFTPRTVEPSTGASARESIK